MHTASYEFLMKPKESVGCHQTLSARVGSGDETIAGGPWNVGMGSVQKVLSSQSSCKTSLNHNWFAK